MNVKMTKHALVKITENGWDPKVVHECYNNPTVVYPSRNHPGQERRIGGGMCLAVETATGIVVTAYVHQVATGLRKDQQNDPAAIAWARSQHSG